MNILIQEIEVNEFKNKGKYLLQMKRNRAYTFLAVMIEHLHVKIFPQIKIYIHLLAKIDYFISSRQYG